MKPQPMITVRFVKRLLLAFVVIILLISISEPGSGFVWNSLIVTGVLTVLILQISWPKTQITVDEESICFNRKFPNWHPLRKYYLHQLIVSHTDWNNWVKIRLSDESKDTNYYLFLMNEDLRFIAKTKENGDLEYWVQKKFQERQLETEYSFRKYRDQYDILKEKDRMKVF